MASKANVTAPPPGNSELPAVPSESKVTAASTDDSNLPAVVSETKVTAAPADESALPAVASKAKVAAVSTGTSDLSAVASKANATVLIGNSDLPAVASRAKVTAALADDSDLPAVVSEEKAAAAASDDAESDGEWDGSPRAVVPSAKMEASAVPLLGTEAHARSSPLPYGLAVCVCDEGGEERQLPLYYVSPKVAAGRGRGVRAGWYVVPDLGRPFKLRVTNVAKTTEGDAHSVVVEIHVDGANIFGRAGENFRSDYPQDEVFAGFSESVQYAAQAQQGVERIRPFKFTGQAVSEGAGAGVGGAGQGAGTLQLRIFKGRAVPSALTSQDEKYAVGAAAACSEKQAVKEGTSVRVDRSGAPMERPVTRMSETVVHDNEPAGVVNVYMRERYWMESRSLVDAQGNVWKPTAAGEAVDLTAVGDTNEEHGNESGPQRKKLKLEVVDLTTIRDEIDLTEE